VSFYSDTSNYKSCILVVLDRVMAYATSPTTPTSLNVVEEEEEKKQDEMMDYDTKIYYIVG